MRRRSIATKAAREGPPEGALRRPLWTSGQGWKTDLRTGIQIVDLRWISAKVPKVYFAAQRSDWVEPIRTSSKVCSRDSYFDADIVSDAANSVYTFSKRVLFSTESGET